MNTSVRENACVVKVEQIAVVAVVIATKWFDDAEWAFCFIKNRGFTWVSPQQFVKWV